MAEKHNVYGGKETPDGFGSILRALARLPEEERAGRKDAWHEVGAIVCAALAALDIVEPNRFDDDEFFSHMRVAVCLGIFLRESELDELVDEIIARDVSKN